MHTVWLFDGSWTCLEITDRDVPEIVRDQMEAWNEDRRDTTVLITDKDNHVIVSLLRDPEEPEVCHLINRNGSRLSFLCHYVFDRNGNYLGTEITPVGEGVSA